MIVLLQTHWFAYVTASPLRLTGAEDPYWQFKRGSSEAKIVRSLTGFWPIAQVLADSELLGQ
jgi:hypothetical protein